MKKQAIFDIWKDTEEKERTLYIPPPRLRLPEHNESVNPPEEYLPTEEEIKEWNDMDKEDRPYNFLPAKYEALRKVPGYNRFIQERFERCLDLYLCPRAIKQKVYYCLNVA